MSLVQKFVVTLMLVCSVPWLVSAQESADISEESAAALGKAFTAQDAAMPLTTGGTYDDNHQNPIVCGPGQTVGLWVKSRVPVTARNMTIRGCPIGIKVEDTDVGHQIEGMVISQAIACIVSGGARDRGCDAPVPGPGIFGNILTGCDFGLIKFGGSTQIFDNHIHHNRLDGMLLGGDCNNLQRNRVTNNGRDGLVLVAKAIMLGPGRFFSSFLDLTRRNIIIRNMINGNTGKDIRSFPLFRCQVGANFIHNNQAGTIDTGCDQDT